MEDQEVNSVLDAALNDLTISNKVKENISSCREQGKVCHLDPKATLDVHQEAFFQCLKMIEELWDFKEETFYVLAPTSKSMKPQKIDIDKLAEEILSELNPHGYFSEKVPEDLVEEAYLKKRNVNFETERVLRVKHIQICVRKFIKNFSEFLLRKTDCTKEELKKAVLTWVVAKRDKFFTTL